MSRLVWLSRSVCPAPLGGHNPGGMPPDDNDDPDAREAWAAYEAEREREAWAARLLALAANPCDEGDEDEE